MGPPQTLTGLAGSEKSKAITPELYIDGLQVLEEGAIATRYNADGTIYQIKNSAGIEVDAVYKLNNIIENKKIIGQEWILIQQ